MDLIPYYNPDVHVNETDSPEKRAHEEHFLDAVLATKTMQVAQKYMIDKKLLPDGSADVLKAILRQLWFTTVERKK